MKHLLILLLACAAAPLAWIGFTDPAPDHVPHGEASGADPVHVPRVLMGEAPVGASLYEFVVDGPCCDGCTQKLYGTALDVAGIEGVAVYFDGNEKLAYGQAWIKDGQDSEPSLTALTFEKYTARESKPESVEH